MRTRRVITIADGRDAIHDCWRRALWLLEAFPPFRRASAKEASPLRRRKIHASIRTVAFSSGEASRSLHAPVVPEAPFVYALMWWIGRHGVADEALHNWNTFQLVAGSNLLRVAGTNQSAHAILTAFARVRVIEPDTAFSDAAIRAATLASLLSD